MTVAALPPPVETPPPLDFMNPDYRFEIERRGANLLAIRRSRDALKACVRMNQIDPAVFLADWAWTYDPRSPLTTMPFMPFPRQVEFLRWMKARMDAKEDGLVEKSRDMGISWLSMAFAVWGWLHIAGFKCGVGSRKEDLVDQTGNMDSLFAKIRFMLTMLPAELLPKGFTIEKHCPFMRILNPENGATITGEAGDNIGRGGRNSIYVLDEAAFLDRPELIDAALSQNCPVKISVSTPNGAGNPFFRKRFSYPKHRVFIFDWRDDPRKDDAWYQRQCEELEGWVVAQEINRDYSASMEGICIPGRWVQSAVGLKLPAEGPIGAGLDVADEGGDEKCMVFRKGSVVTGLKAWKGGDTTETARKAWRMALDGGAEWLSYDNIGVGAGVKGEFNSLIATAGAKIHVVGINSGRKDLTGIYEKEKSNKDMFMNLKAQLCWTLRRRFEKTHEHVTGVREWPVEEMISIPMDTDLITQISCFKAGANEAGKIAIETKRSLRTRGIKSPDRFEALMLAFAPMTMVGLGMFGKSGVGRGARL